MARVKPFMVMCIFLSLSAAARADAAKGVPRGLLIKLDGPLLTVKAKEIPQRQILEEIRLIYAQWNHCRVCQIAQSVRHAGWPSEQVYNLRSLTRCTE